MPEFDSIYFLTPFNEVMELFRWIKSNQIYFCQIVQLKEFKHLQPENFSSTLKWEGALQFYKTSFH